MLVDLKAELFRKQEEFKQQKLQNDTTGYIKGRSSTSEKKPSLFSKKNVGVAQRAEKDYEARVEEEDILEKSRRMMESKARLYEEMSSGRQIPDEDGSGLYLVDFQKKSIDSVMERERREEEEKGRREIEEERRQLLEPVTEANTEDEEWIDFVDALGRSRRCLRKDLPDLQRKDNILQERLSGKNKGSKDFQKLRDKVTLEPDLMSGDMRREAERQEWEQTELSTMEAEKAGPIHYADVQHNEIRNHGVGFFQFAKEEAVRQEQMGDLNKLRQQTVDERSKRERIKEKRKAALDARLTKVKQRKKLRDAALGIEVEETEENPPEEEIGPKLSEKAEKPAMLTRDDEWRKTATITRDWDKGKEQTLERSEKEWFASQRAEREDEFAPPSFYYDEQPKTRIQHKTQGKPKWMQSEKSSVDTHLETVDNITRAQYEEAKLKSDKLLQEVKSSMDTNASEMGGHVTVTETTEQLISGFKSHQDVPTGFNPNVPPPQVGPCVPTPQIDVNIPPQINPSIPPPEINLNVPPPPINPNVPPAPINPSVPPPQMDVNVPPPPVGMNVPPPTGTPHGWLPDTRVPPPELQNYPVSENQPQQTASGNTIQSIYISGEFTVNQSVGSVASAQNFQTTGGASTNSQNITSSHGPPVVQHFTSSQTNLGETLEKPKFVPKMSVIDTRLVQNQDDV